MCATLLDLLLPLRCAACARPASRGLCKRCLRAAAPEVLVDGGPTDLDDGVRAVGLFAYDGVIREVVRGLKIGGRHAAAVPLGGLLRDRLALPEPAPGLALTWLPATRRRRRRRGFDVPHLLAGPAAVPLLERVVEGRDQTTLSSVQRRREPVGAFRAVRAVPPAVVLVDDVRTTGSTARAAALALREEGAMRVLVATLAVGGDAVRADVAGVAALHPSGAPTDRRSGRW